MDQKTAERLMQKSTLPKHITEILNRIEALGYAAYMVGGAVRNRLLGLAVTDYDISAGIPFDALCKLFAWETAWENSFFGSVHLKDGTDITLFRRECGYSDFRHPDHITFGCAPEEDLLRRDFTVNAVAYSPCRGFVDVCGGLSDIEARICRTVGDPDLRFGEDPLRILRAVRFCRTCGLTPEPLTLCAAVRCMRLLGKLKADALKKEMSQLEKSGSLHKIDAFTEIIDYCFEITGNSSL